MGPGVTRPGTAGRHVLADEPDDAPARTPIRDPPVTPVHRVLDTRLVIAIGDPQPGNRNDTIAYRDSGMNVRSSLTAPIAATRRSSPSLPPGPGQNQLPAWQEERNTKHRQVRAVVERCFARMKTYKILRDYRRAARTLKTTAAGIALLHNLALAG